MSVENTLSLIVPVKDGKMNPSQAQKDLVKAFLCRINTNCVSMRISKARKVRSPRQNSFYWGVVLSCIAENTGHTTEEIHQYCKDSFLTRKFVTINGIERSVPKSTTDLTTSEFEAYILHVREWAGRELNIGIPLPNET